MVGVKDYPQVVGNRTEGKLQCVAGSHARGDTFHIFAITAGEKVEVFGVTGGQPGWTETYGWLHEGPWQDDFEKMYLRLKAEQEDDARRSAHEQLYREESHKRKIADLLKRY